MEYTILRLQQEQSEKLARVLKRIKMLNFFSIIGSVALVIAIREMLCYLLANKDFYLTLKETMEHRLQFSWILLLLLMTVYATQTTSIVATKYKKLEPGQNITGTLLRELKTRSKLQCSDRFAKALTGLNKILM